MKQVVLSPRTGALRVADVPAPHVRPGTILVQNAASVVSVGTERLVLELAGKSLFGKARARPDLVREAVNKIRRDGLRTTVREVLLRLDRPHPLGYSSAGTVLQIGSGVAGVHAGDRVACAGAGWAAHAEIVVVPHERCVPLPREVSWEDGAFAMLGAIAFHAVHRAGAAQDEVIAVLGLGLLGQLTVQLLKAAGCRVVAHDPEASRAALAQRLGADAAISTPDGVRAASATLSGGAGADAVIVTAATESNVPLELAAEIARMRAAVVMVGVTGMHVPRRAFWEKELSLLLSKAAGPDTDEDRAARRPLDDLTGSVRWTARRNMAAFVAEVARGAVRIGPLITHRFPIERAGDAYRLIRGQAKAPHLGVVLTYRGEAPSDQGWAPSEQAVIAADRTQVLRPSSGEASGGRLRRAPGGHAAPGARTVGIGVIGAGLFAQTVLLPALHRLPGLRFRGIATASGLSARRAGDRLGFEFCTTEAEAVLADPSVDAVVIATRHDLHARLAAEALRTGKHVFVEKPLGLTRDEIRIVLEAQAASRVLMVGFNRRFSPLAHAVKTFIAGAHPLALAYRINAAELPADHWVYDPIEGGGRWLGEGGHFVDLLQYLTDSDPVQVFAQRLDAGRAPGESLVIALAFKDGSAATIVYADGADRTESRERVEVLGRGFACTLEDFRRVTLARAGRVRRLRRWEAARGYEEELAAWVAAVRGEASPPVDVTAYVANAACCFAVPESARSGVPVTIDASGMLPAAARPGG